MGETTEFIVIAADTLSGDLRDFLLDRQRQDHNPLPWQLRAETEQRAAIEAADRAARAWVRRAVDLIAADGKPAARGSLVKLQAKDGLQMQVNIPASDPLRHALMDHVGAGVLVTIADVQKFDGARGAVPVLNDQRGIFDDEDAPS